MECLSNVIGISRHPCECLEADLPEGYSTSTSGLYMDELPESPISLQKVKSIADCGKDMGTILTNARESAIREFKTELFKQLQATYTVKQKSFTGIIGALSYTANLSLPAQYAGIRLAAKAGGRGAVLTLKGLRVAMDTTANFNVEIYSGNGTLVHTAAVQSTAGSIRENNFATPVALPLFDQNGYAQSYYLVYDGTGMQPKNNSTSCNCGTRETDLANYLSVSGITGDDLNNLPGFTFSNQMNGLLPDVDIRCSSDALFCNNFSNNEFIRIVAERSIQRKAVELLIKGILNSDNVSRYTMANREQMTHNAYGLAKKFTNDVQWISENMNMAESDCYSCSSSNQPFIKTGILL